MKKQSQNKPNLLDAQMNISSILTKDYENERLCRRGENKPNSNPIKANFKKAKMNVNSLITKDYRKKDDFAVRKNKPNSNPISKKPKMNVNLYVIEDYREKDDFAVQKNKPNMNPIQTQNEPNQSQSPRPENPCLRPPSRSRAGLQGQAGLNMDSRASSGTGKPPLRFFYLFLLTLVIFSGTRRGPSRIFFRLSGVFS